MARITPVFAYSFLIAMSMWFFLHGQKSYGEGVPTFDELALKISLGYFSGYYILLGLFSLSLIFFKRLAYWIFACLSLLTLYYSVKLQLMHFNKISILLIFLFIMISYYMCYFLYKESREPYFLFTKKFSNLVRNDLIYPIECSIVFRNSKEKHSVFITSWTRTGIYLKLPAPINSVTKELTLKVEKFGRFFSFDGTIIATTKDSLGFGIKLNNTKSSEIFGWDDLHEILEDRGMGPNYVI